MKQLRENHSRDVRLCRPGFEEALLAECADRAGLAGEITGIGHVITGRGQACYESVFESARLDEARLVDAAELKPLSNATLERIFGARADVTMPWTIQAFTPEAARHEAHPRRMKGITGVLLRLLAQSHPGLREAFAEEATGAALLLCLTEQGLWFAWRDAPWPAFRMKMDDDAPSRSYLKIEEVFARWGVYPRAHERVVDLGAAPGGWTHAFLKRGCDILAVDRGPMKLAAHGKPSGTVRHLRENGLTFQPPRTWGRTDWLVSDMLIAPGEALGLLRRWMDGPRPRRIVCNMKIPQREPYSAVRPLLVFLDSRRDYAARAVQLFHDRREITVMAQARKDGTSVAG